MTGAVAAPAPGRRVFFEMAALFAVVLLSRIPFLDAGYGLHADAWRVALSARTFAETGRYEYSRVPGFPLHELACAALWKWRAVGLNALSAVAGAAGAVLFAIYARRSGCRDYLLAAFGLAFTPAFFISSVSAKDFTLTIAFVLASLLCAARGRALDAGVCLGIAAGCRSIAAFLGLPLTLVLAAVTPQRKQLRRFLIFFASGVLVAAACYVPIFLKFGSKLFGVVPDPLGYPPIGVALERGTVGVWGWLGVIGLAVVVVGVCLWLVRRDMPTAFASAPARAEVAAWILSAAFAIALFVRVPDQAGYLLPAVPFLLLIFARLCARTAFRIFCALLIASPWIGFAGARPVAGPIFEDRRERLATIENIKNFLGYCGRLTGDNIIVVGSWEPQIALLAPDTGRNRFVFLLSAQDVLDAIRTGKTIYYTPTMRAAELRVHGLDLAKYGAVDLRAKFDQERAQHAKRE
jgi:hypothetical protein